MTEKAQFDAFLGGSQSLPLEVNILKLASARANEIAAMTYSIDNPQQTKLVFQKLPIHMRRRIMSHNAKRMPRRLREIHIRQMSKSGLPPKSKRPSRKWRRRAENLISEYKRRQENKIWLETHVWHAKRFKIIDKWGYRIPHHSNNRCFRSSYRAVAKHCLIQDVSYYSCIELEGPLLSLHRILNQHCDPNGLSFAAKCYAQGSREGTVMFFEKNGYPARPVGTVNFIWRPSSSGIRRIWIWAHPSFYKLVLSQIANSFGFDIEANESKCTEFSSADRQFRLVLLRNCLNRFRLTGPLSISLLTQALRLPDIENSLGEVGEKKFEPDSDVEVLSLPESIIKTETEKMEVEGAEEEKKDAKLSWDVNYYRDYANAQSFRVQKDVFELLKDLKSPSQLPPGVVMAFTVLDPRYFLPKQRAKAETNICGFETIPVPPTLANISPIWEREIRELSIEKFRTTNEINKARSDNLVPGVYNDHEYDQDSIHKVPVLFIQRPGTRCKEKSIGFSSGIDVILPSGWATPFWISFILRCGKPGGLRESNSIVFENLSLNSPDFNPPDTEAYAREALERKYRLLEKYFRFPPNRRANYTKLGITSPFYCEWNLLVNEWTDSNSFYVLRDKKQLAYLQENISCPKKGANLISDKTLFKDLNCLVTVKISMIQKGCPKDFAIISLPSNEDEEKWEKDKSWGGPAARILKDRNESERKRLKRGHLALLKRLRRQRIRQREKSENNNQSILEAKTARESLKRKAQSAVDIQAEKMKNLYLPKCKTVRYSCDREVMGYVVKGDFSFTESKGIGLGYVALTSLFGLIERKSDLVLVRNTKSRQYRLARVSILV